MLLGKIAQMGKFGIQLKFGNVEGRRASVILESAEK
jgi:hypothetical protein